VGLNGGDLTVGTTVCKLIRIQSRASVALAYILIERASVGVMDICYEQIMVYDMNYMPRVLLF
jgi:hypothetical protein